MATARLLDHVDVTYPTSKAELLASARSNGAPDQVLQAIRDLPDQTFDGPEDVVAMHGRGGIKQPHAR